MKITIALFVCFYTILLVESIPVQQRKNKDLDSVCSDEAMEKANVCADKLWFVGRRSRKYPENEPELQKHCKQTTNLIKCVKDFTDLCGKEIHKQMANVMLFTVRTIDKSYCTKSVKKQEFMSFGVCGNEIREHTSKCMDEFLNMLGKSNAFENKLKVPHTCCSFYKLKSCIMRSAHNANNQICTERATDNYEKYINGLSLNTLNMFCNEYEEDSDKCQSIPKLPKGAKYSKALSIIDGFGKILD